MEATRRGRLLLGGAAARALLAIVLLVALGPLARPPQRWIGQDKGSRRCKGCSTPMTTPSSLPPRPSSPTWSSLRGRRSRP
eukprot:6861046-Pyramimonas_sp.AAC.1